jgi:hypothetical protein
MSPLLYLLAIIGAVTVLRWLGMSSTRCANRRASRLKDCREANVDSVDAQSAPVQASW